MRKLEVNLNLILEIVSVAEDYGFEDDVLFDALAQVMEYNLSDMEIETYALNVEKLPKCGFKDYTDVKNRLLSFKERFCNND